MTFIKEYISEEDKKKYGHTSTWTVDRERGVFLTSSYFGRDNHVDFKMYDCSANQLLVTATAKDKSSGNPKDGILKYYEIYNIFVPELMRPREQELINLVIEALDAFGHGALSDKIENCTVKVTFPNHKFGGSK